MFAGRVPAEVHQHYDADGQPCRAADAYLTAVSREPEWLPEDTELAMKLAKHESSLCSCGCGQPIAEATDPNRSYRIQTYTCHAHRALMEVERKAGEDAKAKNLPDGWDEGTRYYIDDSFVRGSEEDPRGD